MCSCNSPMKLIFKPKMLDICYWRCDSCKNEKSIRSGSILEKHNKTRIMILTRAIFLDFAKGSNAIDTYIDLKQIYQQFSLCQTTVTLLFQDIRNAIWENMKLSWEAEKFGGNDEILEADETILSHEENEGSESKSAILGIGIVERSTGNARVFIEKKRDAETINRLILNNVYAGSIIYSDSWSGYCQLNSLGYQHIKINKSKKDSDEFGQTSRIEGVWADIKRLANYYSKAIPPESAQQFVAELLLRRDCERHKINFSEQLSHFIKI